MTGEIDKLTLLALRRMRQQAFQMRPPETRPAWVWAVLYACCTNCEQLRTIYKMIWHQSTLLRAAQLSPHRLLLECRPP